MHGPGASQESVDRCTEINRRDQPAAREEEKEPEDMASDSSEDDDASGGHTDGAVEAAPTLPSAPRTRTAIQVLFETLRRRCAPEDELPPTPVDHALNLLRDHAALSKALEKLKSQDKLSLDVVFKARISSIIGVLNLFLDRELRYTWREASMIVAKAQGHGSTRARSIRTWVLDFVQEEKLPLHSYGYTWKTALEDEEVLQEIKEELSERSTNGFIKAQDVCDIVAGKKLQTLFLRLGIHKTSISESTAKRWLAKMKWCYSK
jgi:hypothetical protein